MNASLLVLLQSHKPTTALLSRYIFVFCLLFNMAMKYEITHWFVMQSLRLWINLYCHCASSLPFASMSLRTEAQWNCKQWSLTHILLYFRWCISASYGYYGLINISLHLPSINQFLHLQSINIAIHPPAIHISIHPPLTNMSIHPP